MPSPSVPRDHVHCAAGIAANIAPPESASTNASIGAFLFLRSALLFPRATQDETLTTVVSKTSRNVAVITAMVTNHRLISPGVRSGIGCFKERFWNKDSPQPVMRDT